MSTLRLQLEMGLKGKRVVAVAPDWPGLSRGAKTADAAIATAVAYIPRYAPVAKLAGLESTFADVTDPEVVAEYPGTGSTDFWGISFGFSELDHQPLSDTDLDRQLTLLQGAWAFFDQVATQVSPVLQRGPRGGGRDRDLIIRHTLGSELDMSYKVGVSPPQGAVLTPDGLAAYRAQYLSAIREYHAAGKMARKWPLRFLIRHTAFHSLDHAWEMQDKDLTCLEVVTG